jgi:hypothetical protein
VGTISVAHRVVAQQQVLAPPRNPVTPPAVSRRFTVWSGSTIARSHRTVADLAAAVYALVPAGVWDEVELLLKAGEGGSWQSLFDTHPLAPSGPAMLADLVDQAKAWGLRITPYVVVRGRAEWLPHEQLMIRQCVDVADRCVLNVEPGAPYWNGPNDPRYIRAYLAAIGVAAERLEVCLIPRANQVAELGGAACIQAWTDPSLVGGASWETYDGIAPGSGPTSLRPDVAIPRLLAWGVPDDPCYRVCIVQRNRIAAWADSEWASQGLEVWHLDGDI